LEALLDVLAVLLPPQAASVTASAPAAIAIMSFFMPPRTPRRRRTIRGMAPER
jgi:hypothetical protein